MIPAHLLALVVQLVVAVVVAVVREPRRRRRRRLLHLELVRLPGALVVARALVVLPVVALDFRDTSRARRVLRVRGVFFLVVVVPRCGFLFPLSLRVVIVVVVVVARHRGFHVPRAAVAEAVVVVAAAAGVCLEPLARVRRSFPRGLDLILRLLQRQHATRRVRAKVVPSLQRHRAHVRRVRLHHEQVEVPRLPRLSRAGEDALLLAPVRERERRERGLDVGRHRPELPVHGRGLSALKLGRLRAREPPDDVPTHGRERSDGVGLRQDAVDFRVVRERGRLRGERPSRRGIAQLER
eukprot:31535-Pelagococcus_subviridis.AAC.5